MLLRKSLERENTFIVLSCERCMCKWTGTFKPLWLMGQRFSYFIKVLNKKPFAYDLEIGLYVSDRATMPKDY